MYLETIEKIPEGQQIFINYGLGDFGPKAISWTEQFTNPSERRGIHIHPDSWSMNPESSN